MAINPNIEHDEPQRTFTIDEMSMAVNAAVNEWSRSSHLLQQQTSFDGQRRFYTILGYPKTEQLDFDMYMLWYKRGGIAKRIVSLPANDTWKRPPAVTEDGDEDTQFVKGWQSLVKRLGVWSVLARGDRLSGIGWYGVIVLGVAGKKDTKEPLEKGELEGPDDVLSMRPLTEKSAEIKTWNTDKSSPRFGLPETYAIDVSNAETTVSQEYHWTRVLHLADGKDDSEIYGTPRQEAVFNYLIDLTKIEGGIPEAIWLNMRPGTIVKPPDGYKTTTSQSDIQEYIARYSHDPLRFLVSQYPIDVSQIGTSEVPQAGEQIDKTIELIASTSGIPKRILMGSSAGQLASAQEDTRQWASEIATRQTTYAEQEILRQLIDRLIFIGALSEPRDGYTVGTFNERNNQYEWPSIIDPTPSEEAELVLSNAQSRATLADPITGELPSTTEENRELLGLPPEPQPTETQANALRINQVQEQINMPTVGDERVDLILEQYAADLATLGDQAVNDEISREEFESALFGLVMALSFSLYLAASGKSIAELDDADRRAIEQFQAVNLESVPQLSDDIYAGRFIDPVTGEVRVPALSQRLSLWAFSALQLANVGAVRGDPEGRYRWDLGATMEHCTDCQRLDGQVHTGAEWIASGWLPQSRRLECGGWHCDCVLRQTRAQTQGNF